METVRLNERYEDRALLIRELDVNMAFVKAWIENGMPEDWSLNAKRCSEKVHSKTLELIELTRREAYKCEK